MFYRKGFESSAVSITNGDNRVRRAVEETQKMSSVTSVAEANQSDMMDPFAGTSRFLVELGYGGGSVGG